MLDDGLKIEIVTLWWVIITLGLLIMGGYFKDKKVFCAGIICFGWLIFWVFAGVRCFIS